ncbi:hypothetical protein BC939DRAFT_464001 [Gamsiella multidivaricata]|uniref:uncharacterized protein n=1 Tax=Gamsiella multidivaricata TaxID=101098 RepID=UPI002221299F|nr:uncharacterized protein BC939DRAFT_464001 [Gamsiella multidivaricata]KAG0360431.1 hypothetical protein BGZ54_009563 [Gamsiella multidivaricata]KAI7818101.1 hypothetical protein BC939DRAFT_464001 [Gamsiella multidivaricata]
MQTPGMYTAEGNNANGFAIPKRSRRLSQDSASLSTRQTDLGMQLDRDLIMAEEHSRHADGGSDAAVDEKRPRARRSSNESRNAESSGPMNPPSATRHHRGSSNSNECKDAAASARHYGPYRSTLDLDRRTSQKPLPPRLSGHGRSSSSDIHPTPLLPVSNNTIPSPLASPITATAHSLTALSISQNSAHNTYSGRNLSRITVPRERKTRPCSIASTDTLLAQERARSSQSEDCHQNQPGRLSDPETTTRQGHVSTKHSSKADSRNGAGSSSTGNPIDFKLPTLKPAAQLRVNLYNLVSTGYLPADTLAVFREHSAIVTAKGTLIPQFKEPDAMTLYPWLQAEYETPSAWATAMVKGGRTGKVAVNGWSAIKIPIQHVPELNKMFEGQGLTEVSLDVLRKRYLADMTEEDSAHAEGASAVSSTTKDTAAMDRKKRKRHVAATTEAAGLRISTETGTATQKGRAGTTRPRKRTMSDLSGMVSSDLFKDSQLHLEAAGALFAMQDPFSSPALDSSGHHQKNSQGGRQKSLWRKHAILLDSLARHRQEKGLLWSHAPRPSALHMIKTLSSVPAIVPLGLTSSNEHNEFCSLCSASGSVINSSSGLSTQITADYRLGPAAHGELHERDTLRRCSDCKKCYHLDCIASNIATDGHPSLRAEDPWQCPRCMTCSFCQNPIHESPSSSTVKETASTQSISTADSGDIQVLSCDVCHQFTHLQCQLVLEPPLKDTIQSNFYRNRIEWVCLACRECVECGYRVPAAASTNVADEDSMADSEAKEASIVNGRWSNGSILCPSCTVLAEKGNICPLCCRIYQDDDYETPMIFCDGCSLWVHVACDKGLQDRDYEELGEDSRQYFCPSCIPTPIPSPTHSSSSSMYSVVNSVEQSPWQEPYSHQSHRGGGTIDHSRDASSGTDEDWHHRGRKKKDDILDLIKAAKEISDSESQANSPYNSYSPMFPSTHSRTMSASLESVAEVAAAEALLTIFSGASTPVSSTPYTSYPPSPFEPTFNSFNGIYDRQYSAIGSPQDLPMLMRSMAFTPSSSDQEISNLLARECQGTASCRCQRHRDIKYVEDYFNSQPHSRPTVPYNQIGQELEVSEAKLSQPLQQATIADLGDIIMEEAESPGESLQQGMDSGMNERKTLAVANIDKQENSGTSTAGTPLSRRGHASAKDLETEEGVPRRSRVEIDTVINSAVHEGSSRKDNS